jgi:hypothetical protein
VSDLLDGIRKALELDAGHVLLYVVCWYWGAGSAWWWLTRRRRPH